MADPKLDLDWALKHMTFREIEHHAVYGPLLAQLLVKRYRAKMSTNAMAERYHLPLTGVRRILRSEGVTLRPAGRRRTPRPYSLKKLVKQYTEDGLSVRALAKQYKRPYNTIREDLLRKGVVLRTRAERPRENPHRKNDEALADPGLRHNLAISLKKSIHRGMAPERVAARAGITDAVLAELMDEVDEYIRRAMAAGTSVETLREAFHVRHTTMREWSTHAHRNELPPAPKSEPAAGLLKVVVSQPIQWSGGKITMPIPEEDLDTFAREIGIALRKERGRKNWTRKTMQDEMQTGRSLQTMATHELGTRAMTIGQYVEYCAVLGARPGAILDRVFEATIAKPPNDTVTVNLLKLAKTEYSNLARWAQVRLAELPASAKGLIELPRTAQDTLAALCEFDRQELLEALSAA